MLPMPRLSLPLISFVSKTLAFVAHGEKQVQLRTHSHLEQLGLKDLIGANYIFDSHRACLRANEAESATGAQAAPRRRRRPDRCAFGIRKHVPLHASFFMGFGGLLGRERIFESRQEYLPEYGRDTVGTDTPR